jgi:hypothetical protein
MTNDLQNHLIYQAVAQIDSLVISRSGQQLGEITLSYWHGRLTKLCEDYRRACTINQGDQHG